MSHAKFGWCREYVLCFHIDLFHASYNVEDVVAFGYGICFPRMIEV